MAIISADDERALEVSGGCLAAVAKLRSSSLENACAWFPFGAIPEGSTMLRALKVVNSALAAIGESTWGSKSSSGGLLLESPREQPKFAEGEEVFSVEKMTYLHYLQVECGVSTEKNPMVLALTHLWWLGSEPNEKQIPSTRTTDASFEQVIAAEDHLFAIKLDKSLTLRPWVKLSYCFDATKNVKGEQVNNLIMTATLLDFEGYDEEAVGGKKAGYGADGYPLDMLVERRVVTIDTVVDKSAFGMASASLSSLEKLAEPVDGLYERLLAASIGAVVDHAALAEGRELFEKAKAELERHAGGDRADSSDEDEDEESMRDDMAMRIGRVSLVYVILGDRFHKTQLVIDAGRGADDMNAGQIIYDSPAISRIR